MFYMVEGIRNLHVRFPEGTNERYGRWKKGFAGKGGRDESCSATKTGRPPMRGIHCTVTVSKGTFIYVAPRIGDSAIGRSWTTGLSRAGFRSSALGFWGVFFLEMRGTVCLPTVHVGGEGFASMTNNCALCSMRRLAEKVLIGVINNVRVVFSCSYYFMPRPKCCGSKAWEGRVSC